MVVFMWEDLVWTDGEDLGCGQKSDKAGMRRPGMGQLWGRCWAVAGHAVPGAAVGQTQGGAGLGWQGLCPQGLSTGLTRAVVLPAPQAWYLQWEPSVAHQGPLPASLPRAVPSAGGWMGSKIHAQSVTGAWDQGLSKQAGAFHVVSVPLGTAGGTFPTARTAWLGFPA